MSQNRRVFAVQSCQTGQITFETYSSVKHVIRFGLKKDTYEPGQYDIFETDEGNLIGSPTRAYKRV